METGGLPMDFTDGIENLRANMSAEYDRAYDTLQSDHSTRGSPGKLSPCLVPNFFSKKCYGIHHIESCDTCMEH